MGDIKPFGVKDHIRNSQNSQVEALKVSLNENGTIKKIFSPWEAKNINQVYQADTDGFVHVYAWTNVLNTWCKFYGVTDENTPPTIKRVGGTVVREGDTEVLHSGFSMAVKKGDYWKIFSETYGVGPTITVSWLPVGE